MEATTAAGTGSALLGGTFAARALSFASIAGKVAVVTAVITTALQTIVQGVQVAHLRHELDRINSDLKKLQSLLTDMQKEFERMMTLLRETYESVTDQDSSGHFVLNQEGQRIYLNPFFRMVEKYVNEAIQQGKAVQEDLNHQSKDIRVTAELIRNALSMSIHQRTADLLNMSKRAAHVFKALASGEVDCEIEQDYGVSAQLIAMVRQFRDTYPARSVSEAHFEIDGTGLMRLALM